MYIYFKASRDSGNGELFFCPKTKFVTSWLVVTITEFRMFFGMEAPIFARGQISITWGLRSLF
jgi:hypothetical protein